MIATQEQHEGAEAGEAAMSEVHVSREGEADPGVGPADAPVLPRSAQLGFLIFTFLLWAVWIGFLVVVSSSRSATPSVGSLHSVLPW
ncbi:MAG: hypothetical protein ACPGXK_01700 [Phycisphaerae bacterium]